MNRSDLALAAEKVRLGARRWFAPALTQLRLGRPVAVDKVTWAPGVHTIRTENGTIIRMVKDDRGYGAQLRRWPGRASQASFFDVPGKPWTVRMADAVVGKRGRFEGVDGSFTHASSRWTTSKVQSIDFQPTHCSECARPLLRGGCWRGH